MTLHEHRVNRCKSYALSGTQRISEPEIPQQPPRLTVDSQESPPVQYQFRTAQVHVPDRNLGGSSARREHSTES